MYFRRLEVSKHFPSEISVSITLSYSLSKLQTVLRDYLNALPLCLRKKTSHYYATNICY